MNKFEIKALRKRMGLSQSRFGKLLGVSLMTVQNWEAGHPISHANQILLEDLNTKTPIGFDALCHADNIVMGNGNTLLARHAAIRLSDMPAKHSDKAESNANRVAILRRQVELLMRQNELLTRNMECLSRQLEAASKNYTE